MTAPTKEEFYQAALNSISDLPAVAMAVRAGDPTVLGQIGAQATMLAMAAEHVDASRFESFNKARDATVLADAALKGILPLARSCRVTLSVTNNATTPFQVSSGRSLMDRKGRLYQADVSVTIAPGATANVNLTQKTLRTETHTVQVPRPFYSVLVPLSEEMHLCTLSLWKGPVEFTYSPEFFNVTAGQAAYTVEADEQRRLFIRLGDNTRVGYSAAAGDTFEMRISECEGAITDLEAGEAFTLQYVLTPGDGQIKAALSAVLDTGANPPTIADLRVMARYPAIYDHNAVYLAEFDELLRRYLTPRFLSVWNEQIEEAKRGPNILNTNTLFVSGLVTGMTNDAFESRVRDLIKRADDLYKVRFVPAVFTPIEVRVDAEVSVVHDADAVKAKIRAALLDAFGDQSPNVAQGMRRPILVQAITKILKDAVPALQDQAADFKVTVTMPTTVLPEQFMFISDASLTVNVLPANFGNSLWNY